jgi:phosphate starvation-inducible membrane PsiE
MRISPFQRIDKIGNILVGSFHRLALFTIGATTVYAAVWSFIAMLGKHHASIQDILLLFIYLEIGAMVGIYFQTNHMPVRFLIYIAITAVTRHVVEVVTHEGDHTMQIFTMGGTILVLSLSIFILRYASKNFPSSSENNQ